MSDRPGLIPTLAALLAMAAAPIVVAQDGGTAITPGYMGRAAVRECAQIGADLAELAPELQNRSSEIHAAEAQYLRVEEWLDATEPTLDRSDANALARYNEQARRYSEGVRHYNELLPAHAAVVKRHNALVDTHNERCTKQKFLIKDEIEARASLQQPDGGN